MDYIPDIVENRYYFKETPFRDLMSNRVREILLVCSKYDKFMLEEDGRIDEQLFQEYVSLSLRYPPKFTQVSTATEALDTLNGKYYDLVIVMLSIGNSGALELASKIKNMYPSKPIILLTPISTRKTILKLRTEDLSTIDYLFSWQGNSNIMLAMVKLIEDRMNVDFDTRAADVQVIILVEDSVKYYSSYLPMIYRTLFKQARNLMKEGLNEWQQTTRMRGRPKILLARNYEEALGLYEKYKNNILGIISDISYKKEGKTDTNAGLKLCEYIRNENSEMPILLQSSQEKYRELAYKNSADFLYKNSKTLLRDLENYIRKNYGFGDFAFRDPKTLKPIGYAHDLRSLQKQLIKIPEESFAYHVRNNDISKWLKARALFSLASYLRPKQLDDFESIQATKEFIINAIKNFRSYEGRGTIAEFNKNTFDELTFFSRIGSGSMGGKGRGLAFVDMLLKKKRIMYKYEGIVLSIPRTVVITTEIFDEFIEENNLLEASLEDRENDSELLKLFLQSKLPNRLREDLGVIIDEIRKPLAIRSSSMLEDSQYQPFAGIYATYMISNNSGNREENLTALFKAIKSVYASTY
ncbi:MAG: phosphoenolpyruvate synthase, partial [Spirochaetes bacterium]